MALLAIIAIFLIGFTILISFMMNSSKEVNDVLAIGNNIQISNQEKNVSDQGQQQKEEMKAAIVAVSTVVATPSKVPKGSTKTTTFSDKKNPPPPPATAIEALSSGIAGAVETHLFYFGGHTFKGLRQVQFYTPRPYTPVPYTPAPYSPEYVEGGFMKSTDGLIPIAGVNVSVSGPEIFISPTGIVWSSVDVMNLQNVAKRMADDLAKAKEKKKE